MYFCKYAKITNMSHKDFNVEIEEEKELYGIPKGAILTPFLSVWTMLLQMIITCCTNSQPVAERP